MTQLTKFLITVLMIGIVVTASSAQTLDSGAFGPGSGYSDAEAFWEASTSHQFPLMTSAEKNFYSLIQR